MRLFLCTAILLVSSLAQAETVTAKSWLVADQQGTIVKGENIDAIRPVASISKLITAMIVLDANQDLNERLVFKTFTSKKRPHEKKPKVTTQDLTRRQLLDLALVHSDNHAAMVLCNNYPSGTEGCIHSSLLYTSPSPRD